MTFPHKVDKIWGYEIWFANDEIQNYCGKELGFKMGHRCSMHRHFIKDEVFFITQGRFQIEYGEKDDKTDHHIQILSKGDRFHVPVGLWHRMTAISPHYEYSTIIEVSTFHRDDDVERLEMGGPSPHAKVLYSTLSDL
ncbi:hypothetical protein [uncultured Rubinisphaera sp.]|uniref:cupin domain-containing protein n=1 Tax=uncultured Rubinisphaera sp. TaxID=1678686 RepID=UPI0030D88A61|tara:strand:+ start:1336 stop:1749 length:414 start_codon:yes stop_codon:yes gene_type:complete